MYISSGIDCGVSQNAISTRNEFDFLNCLFALLHQVSVAKAAFYAMAIVTRWMTLFLYHVPLLKLASQ